MSKAVGLTKALGRPCCHYAWSKRRPMTSRYRNPAKQIMHTIRLNTRKMSLSTLLSPAASYDHALFHLGISLPPSSLPPCSLQQCSLPPCSLPPCSLQQCSLPLCPVVFNPAIFHANLFLLLTSTTLSKLLPAAFNTTVFRLVVLYSSPLSAQIHPALLSPPTSNWFARISTNTTRDVTLSLSKTNPTAHISKIRQKQNRVFNNPVNIR